MIRSFQSKALRRFAEKGDPSKVAVPNLARVERILARLDAVAVAEDMNLPGYRFHRLTGRPGRVFAVDASANWRITFRWSGEDAIDVDLEDYH